MKIDTMHSCTFRMTTTNPDMQRAAGTIIALGAREEVGTSMRAMPMPEGEDAATMRTEVRIESDDKGTLEAFLIQLFAAFDFIGVRHDQ